MRIGCAAGCLQAPRQHEAGSSAAPTFACYAESAISFRLATYWQLLQVPFRLIMQTPPASLQLLQQSPEGGGGGGGGGAHQSETFLKI
jgi:hypothetical protein